MVTKVELRTYTTFEADFPDDAEFVEGGDIRRPGGLGIARVLCQMLESRGFKVSEPEQHSFYGWAFDVCDEDLAVWFLLQFPGPWLLLSQDRTSLFRRLFSSGAVSRHRRILEILNDSLVQDNRFREIKWFSKQQFEKGGDRSTAKGTP